MKQFLFFALTFMIFWVPASAQTPCDITAHYAEFISLKKATHSKGVYLSKTIESPKKKSCFSDLISNNTLFIDHLLVNFSTHADNQSLLEYKNADSMKAAYFQKLQQDTLFNSVMTELVHKTIEDNSAKDTVSMDNLLDIAVKFFTILKLNEDDDYVIKVCTGVNSIAATEEKRKPFLEAFSLAAILKHYRGGEFNLYKEFEAVVLDIYKVNLGVDKKERLLRAQGAAFLLMRNNKKLQAVLRKEYDLQKKYLPFVLKTN